MKKLFLAPLILISISAHADELVSPAHSANFAYVIVGLAASSLLLTLGLLYRDLTVSSWSLSDALSEEVTTNLLDKDGKPILDADQKPTTVTLLRASSSRLIALMGLIGIFTLFISFGLIFLRNYAQYNALPDEKLIQQLQNFFYMGMTLFAPYLINKFSGVFDFLSPKSK
jgi:hypothetical protein